MFVLAVLLECEIDLSVPHPLGFISSSVIFYRS